MAKASMRKRKRRPEAGDETAVRERILDAAFAAFMKSGYAAASTLEFATRARVSKRELYALVGNKQEMLIACIRERAKRFDVPPDLPVLRDRETLEHVLASFGTKVLREASDPTVISVFRLAISEVTQAAEVARALDSIARERSRAALRKIMAGAQASGLLAGRPAELAGQFTGLLWRDLQVSRHVESLGAPADASNQHFLLVANQRVKLSFRNARARCDFKHARRRVAALHEHRKGRIEDTLADRGFVAVLAPF